MQLLHQYFHLYTYTPENLAKYPYFHKHQKSSVIRCETVDYTLNTVSDEDVRETEWDTGIIHLHKLNPHSFMHMSHRMSLREQRHLVVKKAEKIPRKRIQKRDL